MFSEVLARMEPFSQEFERRGKKLYLVGGAVRNILLGRPVQDFDFTTDALPNEVQGYFRKVLPTGLQHGTVTVLFQGNAYEVTTFRVDGEYSDGRRPDGVVFTRSLEEDLKRRDFTINAMALDLQNGILIDPHDGRGDLEKRLLRAIGDPGKRFDEDALRLLRLFRFGSQLGFSIDGPTLDAVGPRRQTLSSVSKERIREEIMKSMAGARPVLAMKPLTDLGFLGDIFQGLAPGALPDKSWDRLTNLGPDLRWSFWLTIACVPDQGAWERVLRKLTFSNQALGAILGPPKALAFVALPGSLTTAAKGLIEVWGNLTRVDPGIEYLKALEAEGIWCDNRGFLAELVRVKDSQEPIFLGDLAIGGKELLASGVPPGPRVGLVLKELQKAVWADPELNSSERLIQEIRNFL